MAVVAWSISQCFVSRDQPAVKTFRLESRTVRRAKDALNVITCKSSMKGGWEWLLPGPEPEDGQRNAKMSKPERLATFGNLGHLRDDGAASEVNQ